MTVATSNRLLILLADDLDGALAGRDAMTRCRPDDYPDPRKPW